MAAGILKERKSLDDLYGNPETGFAEFIPTDSYVESYFESLDGMTDGSVGCGQDKGARKPAEDSSGTVLRPRRKRNRNAHQQLLNKLAQLRYRERKRQKQESLENAVDDLSKKIDSMQTLLAQNANLENENAKIESAVGSKDAELEKYRKATPKVNSPDSEGSSRPPVSPQQRKAEFNSIVQEWLATVEELRNLYSLIGMDRSGPNAGCVLKNLADFSTLRSEQQRMMMNIISRVDHLVETIINLCVAVLRLDGPSIDSLMTANYDRCRTLAGWKDEKKWLIAAQELNFSAEQRSRIIRARADMLAKLEEIYSERKKLNLAAVQALLGKQPAQSLVMGSGNNSTITSAEREHLMEVLAALEDNLKKEQRAVSEQEYVTFKHLLTPLQAGLLIIKAFPDHCDCLALASLSPPGDGGW